MALFIHKSFILFRYKGYDLIVQSFRNRIIHYHYSIYPDNRRLPRRVKKRIFTRLHKIWNKSHPKYIYIMNTEMIIMLNYLNLKELEEVKKYIASLEANLRERERLVKILSSAK